MKVRRRATPIKSLAESESQLLKDFKRAVELAKESVGLVIEGNEPDWNEGVLQGIAYRKSVKVDPITTAQIRSAAGAPVTPEYLIEIEKVPLLLEALPLLEGSFFVNYRKVKVEEVDLETWAVVKDMHYFGKPVSGAEIVEVLGGKKQKVVLVRLGLDVVVAEGVETVLLSRILGLPAIQVTEMVGAEEQKTVLLREYDLDNTVAIARRVFSQHGYFIQPEMEPLAEEARKLAQYDFTRLMGGEWSTEERDAEGEADDKERTRVKVWMEIYRDFRRRGLGEDEAIERANSDPAYLRVNSLTELYLQLAQEVEKRWDKVRGRLAIAFEEVLQNEPDWTTGEIEDFGLFWELATVRERNKTSPKKSEGEFASWYYEGEDVEIWSETVRDWVPAMVIGVEPYAVKVRRPKGDLRRVSQAAGIRKIKYSSTVDTPPELWYNTLMEEIKVERFNVTLPVGSNSLRIEENIRPITDQMNSTPLRVNYDTLKKSLSAKIVEVDRLVAICKETTGNENFRPNASADCIKEFYDKRGLPHQKTTATGKPSMDKDVLIALSGLGDELAGQVVTAREAMSELSQMKKWEEFAIAGEVQATWDSLGQPMGRYTAEKPALQNRVVEIRETIEPPLGWSFVSWDLGAAEYVTWASLSGDPVLGQIFKEGRDVHGEMINALRAEVPTLDLHGEEPRQYGKTVNFAILYRMLAWTLAKKLGCTLEQAEEIIAGYKRRAQVAAGYIDQIIDEAVHTGRVATKYGRVREIPILRLARGNELHEAKKTAWHHHNCGTAAEVLKIKTIRVVNALSGAGLYPSSALVALNMHDELIMMVKDEVIEEVKTLGGEAFRRAVPGILPFKVEEKVGKNWRAISK